MKYIVSQYSLFWGVLSFGVFLCQSSGCNNAGAGNWDVAKNDVRSLPADLVDDGKRLVTRTDNIVILLAGGGASGYVRCAHDDDIADHFEDHHTFPRDFTIGAGAIGNPISHFSVAGLSYLYSVEANNSQIHDVSLRMIEALSVTGILTMGLKLAANDHSPNGENYAWPSGHASSSMTVATVMNEFYGPWVGIPLYGLSGLVMYERMETGEHWASDIVFGAALGYVVGKTVADKYKPEIFGMRVMPWVDPVEGVTGVALVKTF
jgi:hypothetical protein